MRIPQILDQKEMPKKARAALLSGRGPDTTDWEIVYHVYLGVLQPGRPGSMANMVISTPRGRMDYIKKKSIFLDPLLGMQLGVVCVDRVSVEPCR